MIIYKINCKCGKKMDPRSKFCKDCKELEKEHKKRIPRKHKLPEFQSLYNSMIGVVKRRATSNPNIICELTFDDFLEFTKTPICSYCGEKVKWMPYRKDDESFVYNLDRKDNSKGYNKENCVVCCSICNRLKSTLKEQLFFSQIKKIYEHKKL